MDLPLKLNLADSSVPMYQQIYEELRHAIVLGRLKPGARLPSTRALAGDLGVSRNTVIQSFELLDAEGYLEAATGSGTFVTRILPEEMLTYSRGTGRSRPPATAPLRLSKLGQMVQELPSVPRPGWRQPVPFYPGIPAYEALPVDALRQFWNQALSSRPSHRLYGYGAPAGYAPLRTAVADYVSVVRGVKCEPDQVIIVSGSQQAIDLSARLLLDPGDDVWVEDPGYLSARVAFTIAGASVVSVPIDDEGIDVSEGQRRASEARLAYVTPSHQFPLGTVMSLARREALLKWAAAHEAWIIEDDYDSEFRYRGRPLPALQGLDAAGRVLYVGTFSKILFPSLRLGYVIVPASLADAFSSAHDLVDRHTTTMDQAVVAEFLSDGQFSRHVRRMRQIYTERQKVLLTALNAELSDLLTVAPADAGMHLVAKLRHGISATEVSNAAAAEGISVVPLSYYASETNVRDDSLIIGYTGFQPHELRHAANRLASVVVKIAGLHTIG